ncbi:MAG: hypothetical protein U0360_03995 [Dehalococcoidia bacterium]
MSLLVSRRALALLAGPLAVLVVGIAAWFTLGPGFARPGVGGPGELAFAEFGAVADRVYVAPASNLATRRLVATIDHVEGWGINPAFSLSGSRAAYTVLPPDSLPRRDSPAELWLLDLATGESSRLTRDADLLAPPAFDAAGRQLVYRSTQHDGRQQIVAIDLATRVRRPVHTYDGGFGVYPAGFAADGAVVFASLSATGTDLYRTTGDGRAELIAHASDQIARDWRIAPDGQAISYLAPELRSERWVYRLHVVDMSTRQAEATPSVGAPEVEQFGPVWTPDGAGLTLGREPRGDSSGAAMTLRLDSGDASALPAPAVGFDVPVAWSPDGRHLVARSFDGVSSYEPGRESVVVISDDGTRRPVSSGTELIVLGWLRSG